MDAEDTSGDYTGADVRGRVPMARFATPEDVARVVAFLADPEWRSFVDGHTPLVDGGRFADGSWETLRVVRKDHFEGPRSARREQAHVSHLT